ncbi:MAG: TRAP transporter small permease subunit [Alphaproteobacteria bacterium]
MRFLIGFVQTVERANNRIGRAVSWLTLATVLVCFLVVLLRYAFNIGFRWMQEAYVWIHAVAFMGGAAYTLLHGRHVRVDIFYRSASTRTKAWVDLVGTAIFLMPFLAVVAIWSWPYVAQSWMVLESSRDSDGMPGVFLLKSVILVFVALLAFQGLAIMARSVLVLLGGRVDPPKDTGHGAAAL